MCLTFDAGWHCRIKACTKLFALSYSGIEPLRMKCPLQHPKHLTSHSKHTLHNNSSYPLSLKCIHP